MEMTKLSCEKFLAELASKAPTPGGGGTAALVGAAGVALGNMVGNLTTGKKKYAAVEADIQALNTKADALRKELEALVQADADAFADKIQLLSDKEARFSMRKACVEKAEEFRLDISHQQMKNIYKNLLREQEKVK